MHNNQLRKVNPHREHLSKAVPAIAVHTYWKQLEPPTTEEFSEILEVNFVPKFVNKEDEACFNL